MLNKIQSIKQRLEQLEVSAIWAEFKLYPFAVYNQTEYYLVDQSLTPAPLEKISSGIYRGKTDERFLGNTAIKYENGFIAIWDEQTIGQMGKNQLTSMMVHEMFHAFQLEKGEQRFPNELLGASYPLTVENLMLRYIERDILLQTCIAETPTQQLELLANYLQLRAYRQQKIGDYLSFEKGIESVEGVAVYVEYKVLQELTGNHIKLEDFINGYLTISKEHLKIRLTSYHQGFLLSLIADQILGDWQEEFMKSNLFLSDFIEATLDASLPVLEPLNIEQLYNQYSKEEALLNHYVKEWNRQHELLFKQFEQHKVGETLFNPVKITGIDPMNLIMRNDEVLHQNFLRINRGEGDEVLKGPIKTEIGEHIFDVVKIEW